MNAAASVTMKQYKIVNGTSYDTRTPDEVIQILERSRMSRTRLHISLGDTETGRDWLEEHDVFGHVGRSAGQVKIPLLIATRRSIGGSGILDHCIVRIRVNGTVIYQHSNYHFGTVTIRRNNEAVTFPDGRQLTVNVLRDGQIHASFESIEKAIRWTHRLGLLATVEA